MIGLALFLTTGGHLAILQGVAWTKMVRDFSRTESIGKAIEKTLDGQHPCHLCKTITETGAGKKDDGMASAKIKLGEFVDQAHRKLPAPADKPFYYPKGSFEQARRDFLRPSSAGPHFRRLSFLDSQDFPLPNPSRFGSGFSNLSGPLRRNYNINFSFK